MTIQVTKEKTPEEVQAEFCTAFPYLKLAFFERIRPACPTVGRPFTVSYGGRMRRRAAEPAISEETSVGQVEQLLNAALGLSVRVLRRSGNRWQDVGISRERTLGEQNDQGRTSARIR